MDKRPLLLLSNDDGINAKGLADLMDMLSPMADLFVIAPDSGRSGSGCSITSKVPVNLKLLESEEGLTVYSCSGTPVDCIKLALDQLIQRQPDMVISGINHGGNAAVCVHYSGTVNAAMEGALHGIPSMALSMQDLRPYADFSPMTDIVLHLVQTILENGMPFGSMLNVNFPLAEEYRGIRVCRMGYAFWENEFTPCHCVNRGHYYWLGGEMINDEPNEEDTDLWALEHGYVAITPIKVDMTDYDLKTTLATWDL